MCETANTISSSPNKVGGIHRCTRTIIANSSIPGVSSALRRCGKPHILAGGESHARFSLNVTKSSVAKSALVFDQHGTIVDMQKGLTELVESFLRGKGWKGEANSFVTLVAADAFRKLDDRCCAIAVTRPIARSATARYRRKDWVWVQLYSG